MGDNMKQPVKRKMSCDNYCLQTGAEMDIKLLEIVQDHYF